MGLFNRKIEKDNPENQSNNGEVSDVKQDAGEEKLQSPEKTNSFKESLKVRPEDMNNNNGEAKLNETKKSDSNNEGGEPGPRERERTQASEVPKKEEDDELER